MTLSPLIAANAEHHTRPEFLDEAFRQAVADLLDLPELRSSRQRIHHFDLSEYDHLVQVAHTAHRVSRIFRADSRVCARAGLLHDLGAHWFNTGAPVALAARLAEPAGVRHAIRAHTLLPELPRTREAWAVVTADFLTTASECRFVLRRTGTQAKGRIPRMPRVRTRIPMPRRLALPKGLQFSRRLSPFVGVKPGPFVRLAGLS